MPFHFCRSVIPGPGRTATEKAFPRPPESTATTPATLTRAIWEGPATTRRPTPPPSIERDWKPRNPLLPSPRPPARNRRLRVTMSQPLSLPSHVSYPHLGVKRRLNNLEVNTDYSVTCSDWQCCRFNDCTIQSLSLSTNLESNLK